MLVLLPISCWLLLWFIRGSRLNGLRRAFLEAPIVWATFVVIVTEFLSLFTSVTQIAVAIAWAIALSASVVLAVKSKSSVTRTRCLPVQTGLSHVHDQVDWK